MKLAALLLAAILAACGGGGGGSSVTGTITPAAPPRADLLFGYWGGLSQYVQEVRGHTNLFWSGPWDALDQLAALTQAKGMATVVAMPFCLVPVAQGEGEARTWLKRLHDVGLLEGTVAVSWCDEPDTVRSGQWSDANAAAMNAAVRRAMATFPELAATPLAVVYACDTGRTPGFTSFGWVACDHYPSGCGIFAKYVEAMRARLAPGQRLFLLPGGAEPYRQDPACFENYANLHPEVVAVTPWIYQSGVDGPITYVGIRENATRQLYLDMGKRLTR